MPAVGWDGRKAMLPKLEMGSISRRSPGPNVTLKYNQTLPDVAGGL